ncbi:MAG: DoxX family protein [Leptospira sp.]|nr:DoxX family protein [Leptospira sp.]
MKYLKFVPFGMLTLGCLLFGGMKVVGAEEMLKNMANLNYPEWFTRLLGIGEIFFGVLIWMPKFRKEAVLLLFGIFSGAIGSHLGHGDPINSIAPASVFLFLTSIIFVLNKEQTPVN